MVLSEFKAEGAQDKIDDALNRLNVDQILKIWEENRETIIESMSTDDLSAIEKQHYNAIYALHEERLAERRIREEQE
jgi:hypothetical protein